MSASQSLPVLYAVGTHYEVGYSIGNTFAERIKSFWRESSAVHAIDIPFHKTQQGKDFFASALEVCQKNFPQYVREIQGMADGSGVSFEELFILNIAKEVHNILSQSSLRQRKANEMAGCTDVFVNTKTCKLIGHNEDCDPKIKPYGYIVSARILNDAGVEEENFTAYCYPGVLPGTALTFNSHGMVFTIDGLYADFIVHGAPPRIFLNRSIIKARTFDEAIELIKNKGFGVAYGFTANITDLKSPSDMWSVEIGPQAGQSSYHIHTVPEVPDSSQLCHYIHANNFRHLKTSEIPDLKSSIARFKRAEELPPPKNRNDIISILGDQGNDQYPIFRTVRPTDQSSTVFTGIVDVLKNRVDIYLDNPAHTQSQPLLHFSILDS